MESKINIEKLHTTPLGELRISRNLGINNENVLDWCKQVIAKTDSSRIIRKGKNWYVHGDACVITINYRSSTIITAYPNKRVTKTNLPKDTAELYNTYYLKSELQQICKKYNLPANGSKEELLHAISRFIGNKPVEIARKKPYIKSSGFIPALDALIDENYSNNEIHRAFFKAQIGAQFKFNVSFMNWMDEYRGIKTYQDAIDMYHQILAEKKSGKKSVIGKQFEYNQYTRDFFASNPTLSKSDCIKCWNYKKQQTGKHAYEAGDLRALG
jgi:hypothetical protein